MEVMLKFLLFIYLFLFFFQSDIGRKDAPHRNGPDQVILDFK